MSRYTRPLLFALLLLALAASPARAFDVWQYPEAADRGAIFAGAFAASFSYDFADPSKSKFGLDYPEVYLDYVLPVGLPFSFGLSFDPFRVDQYGFGARPGYHLNFDSPNLDAYLLYSVDLDISLSRMVLDHGVRAGLRYVFNGLFCLTAETGHRFQSVKFGVSIRLN